MSRWDGLDEFLAVATTGSFTKAAQAIGMSPTHMSRSIMALEQRVNAKLFDRTTRAVRLTDTGRAFFERCERIAQDHDEAVALIGEQSEPQGELRVTCSTTMGERFVAPILLRFASHHHKLGVSIELTNRIIDLVAEGYDLAIRTGSVIDQRLVATRVASRTLYTCAAPTYLARSGRPTSIEELSDHSCIVGTSNTWHYSMSGRNRSHRATGRFRCNSGQAVIDACVAGFGICQLPDFYVRPFLKRGMVELILNDAQPDDEPIWAVYPRRWHLLPKVQYAVEALRTELAAALNGDLETL